MRGFATPTTILFAVSAWVFLCGLCLSPSSSLSATWQVTFDPQDPDSLIGRVARQAQSGDTILIGPGIYYEHIPLGAKSLTFIGAEGAEATVLDGSRPFDGYQGSVIYTVGVSRSDSLVIENLTFTQGQGSEDPWELGLFGGAVYLNERRLFRAQECRFVENKLIYGGESRRGGALGVASVFEVELLNCEFVDNQAVLDGGAVDLHHVLDCRILSCTFLMTERPIGPSPMIGTSSVDNLIVDGCHFESQTVFPGQPAAMYIDCLNTTIANSTFTDYGGRLATKLYFRNEYVEDPPCTVRIEGNLFWYNPALGNSDESITLVLGANNTATVIRGNTVVCGQLRFGLDYTSSLDMSNNIVYDAEVGGIVRGDSDISCNCIWPDSLSFWGGVTPYCHDNIFQNPLFCDVEGQDLHIAKESPCTEENSPAGCGLVGLEGVGCSISPVEKTGWGSLKNRFKGK